MTILTISQKPRLTTEIKTPNPMVRDASQMVCGHLKFVNEERVQEDEDNSSYKYIKYTNSHLVTYSNGGQSKVHYPGDINHPLNAKENHLSFHNFLCVISKLNTNKKKNETRHVGVFPQSTSTSSRLTWATKTPSLKKNCIKFF